MSIRYLFFILFIGCYSFFSSAELQKIIKKYGQSSGVKMKFKKTTYLDLLKKQKISQGQIWIKKTQFLLKIEDALKTKIIFNGEYIWYFTDYDKNRKKMALDKTTKNKIILSILFNPTGLSKEFKIISSRFKGRAKIILLSPINKTTEIDSLLIKTENQRILQIQLKWKNPKDIEEYNFSDIQFNQKISAEIFNIKSY